jgi:hypothetical protein
MLIEMVGSLDASLFCKVGALTQCADCLSVQASQPTVIYLLGMVMGTESYSFLQTVKVLVVCTGVSCDEPLVCLAGLRQLDSMPLKCGCPQRVVQTQHIHPAVTSSKILDLLCY